MYMEAFNAGREQVFGKALWGVMGGKSDEKSSGGQESLDGNPGKGKDLNSSQFRW